MKFIPRNNQFIGRMTIKKSDSTIILTDAPKVTKYILVDAVGPGAAAAGIKVGDLVVVMRVMNMVLDAGRVFIPWADEKDVGLWVTDVTQDDLLIQTPNGKEFVPFDSDEASPSYGKNPQPQNGRAADAAIAGAPV